MIHLRLRTEYSFRRAYGKVEDVVAAIQEDTCAITDNGTWGHVPFFNACVKSGKHPILGVEILVVQDARKRERQWGRTMAFLAKDQEGLQEVYALVTRANTEGFYYLPRLDYADVNQCSNHVVIVSGAQPDLGRLKPNPNFYLELNPSAGPWNQHAMQMRGYNLVVCADNYYLRADDRPMYDMLVFDRNRVRRTAPMHLVTESELRMLIPGIPEDAFLNTERIAAECVGIALPKAEPVHYSNPTALLDQCVRGAAERKIDLADAVYSARLQRELTLIHQKNFQDYFYVIADMVQEAKRSMLVGPGRGSSAGSLVCYLLGITDVDPIKHDLMFERFIDITRADLPDIDIDFPDEHREEVFDYLRRKYGADHVAHLGTINRYKAKSAIDDVCKALRVPAWEVKDLKGAVIERSTGDARAQFCIADAFTTLDLAKGLLQKYPGLAAAQYLEVHARYNGKHAAGIAVCNDAVSTYCSVDHDGTVQIDKHDAEDLGILKIDVLGLRTLTVLQDCLAQINKDRQWLLDYPLTDTAAFALFNAERFAGIFQFEGYALQSLTRQMKIKSFDDIVAITTLARPGPLHCGGASEFIQRRTGQEAPLSLHPLAEEYTNETYGVIIYQEQVMAVGRKLGKLSWEDVSQLRKAMSKTLGEEFFNHYWEKFKVGAKEQNIPEGEARAIWDKMCTFGSWAFNKSHAVSYALISYWCAVLKAHHPLQWAAACLKHERDETSSIKMLRELSKEGYDYLPVDPEHSGLTWSVVEGRLVGGLTAIKGIGQKKAEQILARRAAGKTLTPGLAKAMAHPVTPYDDIFEAHRRFHSIYTEPKKHKVLSGPVVDIATIQDPGEYRFIGRLTEKNLRDLNEYGNVVKRGGKLVKHHALFLNLLLEDDSGSIIATIDRFRYPRIGKPIVEDGKIGDWYLWKGEVKNEWRMVLVTQVKKLSSSLAAVSSFSLSSS